MGKGAGSLRFHRALAAAVKLELTVHRKDRGCHRGWQRELTGLWITANKVYSRVNLLLSLTEASLPVCGEGWEGEPWQSIPGNSHLRNLGAAPPRSHRVKHLQLSWASSQGGGFFLAGAHKPVTPAGCDSSWGQWDSPGCSRGVWLSPG